MGDNRHDYGSVLRDGVRRDDFSSYMFFVIFHKGGWNRFIFFLIRWQKEDKFIFMDVDEYVKQAKKAEFIEETPDHALHLTNLGKEIYVWYYPLLKFLKITFAGTNVKSIAIAAIIFWLFNFLSQHL